MKGSTTSSMTISQGNHRPLKRLIWCRNNTSFHWFVLPLITNFYLHQFQRSSFVHGKLLHVNVLTGINRKFNGRHAIDTGLSVIVEFGVCKPFWRWMRLMLSWAERTTSGRNNQGMRTFALDWLLFLALALGHRLNCMMPSINIGNYSLPWLLCRNPLSAPTRLRTAVSGRRCNR
jgi:hypothetical protein